MILPISPFFTFSSRFSLPPLVDWESDGELEFLLYTVFVSLAGHCPSLGSQHLSRAWCVFLLLLLASRVAFFLLLPILVLISIFLAHTLVWCFRSIFCFIFSVEFCLISPPKTHILVSLFPTVRGLDRKIPSGSVFLYIRFLKLAPCTIFVGEDQHMFAESMILYTL